MIWESTYKVDEKGRVPVPPKYRGTLQKGLVLAKGLDKCIRVYTLTEWEKLEAKISTLPENQKGRRYRRFYFAGSFEMKMDRLNRITLPPSLRQYAEINDSITFAGEEMYLEIWNPDRWQAESKTVDDMMWQIAESIESEHSK